MASKWNEDNSWDIYPVQVDEIWKVGPHEFSCLDLMENDIVSALGCSVDVVYMFPPCNPGKETYYRRKAGLERSEGWDLFLERLLKTCMVARLDVWMEGTVEERYAQRVIDAIDDPRSFDVIEERQCTYYRKHPCLLYRLRRPDMPPLIEIGEIAIDVQDIPHDVLQAYPKGVHVLDPCIGEGRIALAGVQAGHRVFGNELNPRRLAVTLHKLHDLTGIKPESI